MTAHKTPTPDELIALETSYWDAITAKDGKMTAALSGDIVTRARGVTSLPQAKLAAMTEDGAWGLESSVIARARRLWDRQGAGSR